MRLDPLRGVDRIECLDMAGIADILVQKQYEKRESIDWRRNFVFYFFLWPLLPRCVPVCAVHAMVPATVPGLVCIRRRQARSLRSDY